MQQKRKTPLRMCMGCGEMKPKQELIRAVRSPEGEISLDLTGKKNGRGAYICRDSRCLTAAIKAKRFERAFGCKIEQPVYDSMLSELDSDEHN